nr:choice-of-anchor D domain-containing protein [uncultured Psychroserpens sp.]
MKKNYSLILIAFLCSILSGYGQIFSENFTGQNGKGAVGPNPPTIDLTGVPWSIDISSSDLSANTDWFRVQNEVFEARDVDGISIWLSPSIDISAFTDVEFSLDASEQGNHETEDILNTEYRINGGTWLSASTNGNLNDDFTNATVSQTGLNGTTLEIRVIMENNAGTEYLRIDNVLVNGTPAVTSDLAISGSTLDHGSTCINTAATTIQYTITNNGAVPAVGVDAVSDNPEFVVSNLSTTTIAPAGTATYDLTFTPTTVGAKSATITVSSTTITDDATSTLTGLGITTPTISIQPTNVTRVIPNTATFTVASSDATSYQWQVDTGAGFNNVTGGTGATTDTYTTTATNAAMHNNVYRCVLTNACGSTNSNGATLTLTNSNPSNAQNLEGCFEDTLVDLSWNNPSTPPTGGYIIFAIEGATQPTVPTNDANTYTANSDFSAAPFETPASLGKVVYKGNGTTATVTGLTEDTIYSFRIFAYNGEALTGYSNGTSGGSNLEQAAQGDVSNLVATPLTNQVNLNWNNSLPTSCFDQLLIVANEGPVVFTPAGTYTNTDVDYSTPNSIVYATMGTVSVNSVGGLTNGTNYCFKVFIRRGTEWSEGVEVCAVPSLTYCTSEGNGTDGFLTLINNVEFNTIDNASPTGVDNGYSDFTSISTDVVLGETYNLNVRVETDGAYTTTTRAWIDWNNDGTFDANEQYELGNAFDVIDGSTDGSPLAIEVPTNAAIAATRMRVSTRFGATTPSTACFNAANFDGEVEDYTINVIQPVNAEMNIKGNNISIANGFDAPYGLNNTLFGSQDVGSTSAFKNYFVENIGATTLNLTGNPRVEIIGAHAGDFNVTQQPNATVGSLSSSEFRIVFSPTADGTRTATVRIENTDSDEDPYEFDIEGTAVCSTILTSSMWPTEGPENTEVTITSANDLTGATATINGETMTIVSSTATELVVLVPAGAISGNLQVLFSTGCSSTNAFTVIDNVIGGCETAAASTVPSDLFISEISDASSGSSSLIEIFNGTAGTINLANYSIRVFNNGSSSPSTTSNLVGSLAPGELHVISIGTTSCDLSATGLASGLPDQAFNSAGGINFDNNSSDAIQLFNGGTPIDSFGVIGSSTWANGLGIDGDGVNYRRQNTAATLPNTTFDITEWDEFDWTSCDDSDYSNFGLYDFSLGVPPTVSVLNAPSFSCASSTTLTVTGTEGVPSGFGLVYQWYYLAPNATTFVVVPDNADFNDVTTNTLEVVNSLPFNEYQFYCQVRENTASCYSASNAVKLVADGAVWDGTNWSSPPTIDKIAVIDGDYDTSIGANGQTSFDACQLIVNTDYILTIQNNDYVKVQNNVTVNGNIVVKSDGAFVQVDDLAIVNGDVLTSKDKISVEKETAPLATYQEYTYWSSPVNGELIGDGLFEGDPNRTFWYNGRNFLDETEETGNNDATVDGQDDIDDNANDWQIADLTTPMLTGVGYAATHNSIGFMPGQFIYVFEGPFNNGIINVPIYRNDAETNDNNWNFIGNPYPSAIDADLFLAANGSIDQTVGATNGAIFFWSHNTAADGNTNGNEVLNYTQSDYAIINGTGQLAGGDNVIPTRHIPSGQGFFVSMDDGAASTSAGGTIRTTDVVFNNSMRVTGNNDQFFRNSNVAQFNKLRINLTSDNGIFNQILVGYVDGATNDDDGMYYDATRNLAANASSIAYSLINTTSDKKFAIQGKAPSSLTLDEVIPLGFYTSIDEATLYKFSIAELQGEFMNSNTVYIKDNLMNITHDLNANDYTFTSETGEFNDRFEIVFQRETLSVESNELSPNDLTIVELGNGDVKFSVGKNITIKSVEILDVLGRTIYNLRGQNNTETYNLSQLSQATYIARVTLSNGQTITKKAMKIK